MRIDVWSDIACPWCYLGKHRIERALAQFGGEHEVVFHAFELNPGAPKTYDDGLSHTERLAKKFGRSPAEIETMHERMRGLGTEDGIDFHFDRVKGGNTFDAHRLVQLGLERGVQNAVKERLMKAYFDDGEPIADREVLARLGAEAGLDATEVREMLASDRYTAEVRADEAQAQELGVTGVPFFVLAGKVGVPGAQAIDVLLQALAQAQARG
jgi:predicted DsbA family dithiol-disulfide isomerase